MMIAVKLFLLIYFHFVGGTAPAPTNVRQSGTFFLSADISKFNQAFPETILDESRRLTENSDGEEEPDALVLEDDDEDDTEAFSRKSVRSEKYVSGFFDTLGSRQFVYSSHHTSFFEPPVLAFPSLYLTQQALRI